VTDCFTFRAAFFTGAGLGLDLAAIGFVAFAALDTLRGLPRLAEFALRSLVRLCTFDPFLRLAMITPFGFREDTTVQVAASYQTRVINRSQLERDCAGVMLPWLSYIRARLPFGPRPPADKKIAGLLGAAAALTTMSAAQSAVAEPTRNTPPTSYATSWSRFRMH
jgi:hypothetical protein